MATLLAARARAALASRLGGSGVRAVAPASRALAGLAPASRSLRTRPLASSFCEGHGTRLMSSTSKRSGFEKLKSEWNSLDLKSKLGIIEMLGKFLMIGISSSVYLTMAENALERIAKVEEAGGETKEEFNEMKVVFAKTEERSLKHIEETTNKYNQLEREMGDKYHKLEREISELRTFKDLLISQDYKTTVPVPGAEEKK